MVSLAVLPTLPQYNACCKQSLLTLTDGVPLRTVVLCALLRCLHARASLKSSFAAPRPPAEKWGAAHRRRDDLLGFIARAAGATTLLDVGRYEQYDAAKRVDAYLNQPHVKVCGAGAGGLGLGPGGCAHLCVRDWEASYPAQLQPL